MMSILKRMAALAAAIAMAACGGGSGGGTSPFGGGGGGVVPPPVASDIALTLSTTNIANSGTQTVAVEVTAVDAARVALSGIPVTFSVDNNAVLVVGATATDATGKVRATVGIGNDKSNRVVTVKATSGGLERTAAFQVTGAKFASATAVPAVLAPAAAGEVQYRVTDANDNPIAGVPIAVAGNGIAPAEGTTGSNGDYVFKYTAPAQAGTVDITANSVGVTRTTSIIVQAGSGSIPNVTPGSVLSASVSANPSVVSVNTATTNNRSEIRALFLGANNAPIKNVRVRFDLDGDANSIGGTISSASTIVYADVNGVASTAYIPGSRSSPTDGVTVRACWGNTDADLANGACPNAARTTLTVISEALAVTIGTNNKLLIGPSGLTYIQRYVVLVVDSSGQAKADVQITPSIDLPYFFKGSYRLPNPAAVPPETGGWQRIVRAACDNEDLNRNGVIEFATEDQNLNGSLEPRKSDVAISVEGNGKTDATGIAVLRIEYPQSHASWVAYKILVAASGVSGTEGRTSYSGVLAVLAADVAATTVDPPFRDSPYGVEPSGTVPAVGPMGQTVFLCTNPN